MLQHWHACAQVFQHCHACAQGNNYRSACTYEHAKIKPIFKAILSFWAHLIYRASGNDSVRISIIYSFLHHSFYLNLYGISYSKGSEGISSKLAERLVWACRANDDVSDHWIHLAKIVLAKLISKILWFIFFFFWWVGVIKSFNKKYIWKDTSGYFSNKYEKTKLFKSYFFQFIPLIRSLQDFILFFFYRFFFYLCIYFILFLAFFIVSFEYSFFLCYVLLSASLLILVFVFLFYFHFFPLFS